MYGSYRKRPRLDGDSEAADVTVKTEPLIPGLDLADNTDIKEEDILNTGAVYTAVFFLYFMKNDKSGVPGSTDSSSETSSNLGDNHYHHHQLIKHMSDAHACIEWKHENTQIDKKYTDKK